MTPRLLLHTFIRERADACGNARVFARQIFADRLPAIAAIGRLEQNVGRVIKDVGVHRRKDQRLGAVGADTWGLRSGIGVTF